MLTFIYIYNLYACTYSILRYILYVCAYPVASSSVIQITAIGYCVFTIW